MSAALRLVKGVAQRCRGHARSPSTGTTQLECHRRQPSECRSMCLLLMLLSKGEPRSLVSVGPWSSVGPTQIRRDPPRGHPVPPGRLARCNRPGCRGLAALGWVTSMADQDLEFVINARAIMRREPESVSALESSHIRNNSHLLVAVELLKLRNGLAMDRASGGSTTGRISRLAPRRLAR